MATPDAQLQAIRLLKENWDGYGAAVPRLNILELAREFASLIEALLRKHPDAPTVLHVSPTRIGGVLIEWEDDAMQHEVEIDPDQSFSFLHRNKATGHIETRKFLPDTRAVVHPGFLHELRQLLAA
jgi:hypothetical protein